jgi:hypothetical protein
MISVTEWVRTAFSMAKLAPDVKGLRGIVNQDRSRRFVEALGDIARNQRNSDSERVLTKHNESNHAEFGLNELLFDVLWCDTAATPAMEADVMLRYVTRGKWAVESEFAGDSRKALFDFNKLVLADAEAKLFIGPTTPNWKAFLAPLGVAAENVRGQLYVALVPHPREWKSRNEQDIMIFRWSSGSWENEK